MYSCRARLTLLEADFFDGKHNVVLGGSWATHPRLAGRKSL
jgi:L-histidine Nalpha-methyltransferase / hercynylcysteine S-oxide synthase